MSNQPAEEIVFKSHAAPFASQPVQLVVAAAAMIIGVAIYGATHFEGGVGLIVALVGLCLCLGGTLGALATELTITTRRTILKSGLLSRHTCEVRHQDVRSLEVFQGLFDRILGVGSISVSSAGQGDVEIQAYGFKDPEKIKEIIDRLRP